MTQHQTPPSDKLLPCPFCGGEAKFVHPGFHNSPVVCHANGCAQAVTIAAWNRRVAQSAATDVGVDVSTADDVTLAERILERLGYAVNNATRHKVLWAAEEIAKEMDKRRSCGTLGEDELARLIFDNVFMRRPDMPVAETKTARSLLAAQAILSRLTHRAEGWKLVPVEPTEEMTAAGHKHDWILANAKGVYKAMLAAAPTPPTAQEG